MLRIYCVGKIKEDWMVAQLEEDLKSIRKQIPIEIIEIKDLEAPAHYSPAQLEQVKEAEGAQLLAKIQSDEYVIALDLHGKALSTPKLLEAIRGNTKTAFVIGGSLGISDALLKRANLKVKISDMTFTHLFARLMLLEQLKQL